MNKYLLTQVFGFLLCFQGTGFCNTSKLDEYLSESIALIEENAIVLGSEDCYDHLANHYYFDQKCYRKGMYWALKGSEQGCSDCMLLLRNAYAEGLGVIPDTAESLKWLMLAAAIGNLEAQKDVKRLEFPSFSYSTLSNNEIKLISKEHEARWNKAKKRANTWMEEHQSLFISKN